MLVEGHGHGHVRGARARRGCEARRWGRGRPWPHRGSRHRTGLLTLTLCLMVRRALLLPLPVLFIVVLKAASQLIEIEALLPLVIIRVLILLVRRKAVRMKAQG